MTGAGESTGGLFILVCRGSRGLKIDQSAFRVGGVVNKNNIAPGLE